MLTLLVASRVRIDFHHLSKGTAMKVMTHIKAGPQIIDEKDDP